MVTDQRRREIESYLVTTAKAEEYLQMLENTIVSVHRDAQGGVALAVRLKKIHDILEVMANTLLDTGFTMGKWQPILSRIYDLLVQYDAPPPDAHTHQVVAPGAEMFLDLEAERTYKLDGDPQVDAKMTAVLLDSDGRPFEAKR